MNCRFCDRAISGPSNHRFCTGSCLSQYIAGVKASHDLVAFLQSIGVELKREGSRGLLKGSCPFHHERTPSFYVYTDGHWRCYGTCKKSGDVIDAFRLHYQKSSQLEAAEALAGESPIVFTAIVPIKKELPRGKMWLPKLQCPTAADFRALSESRSISIPALRIGMQRGFWWCFDCDINGRCWLYTDQQRKCAIRRRIDDQLFQTRESKTKAAACYRADMRFPLGYKEAQKFPCFAVVEGGPNGLAVLAQALAFGVEDLVSPVVMPCSGAKFHPESLEALQGKRGRIYIDNDPAGRTAAAGWTRQLREAGIEVDGFSFDGLTRIDEKPAKDLNDVCRLDPDSFEENFSALESIMDFTQPERASHGWYSRS